MKRALFALALAGALSACAAAAPAARIALAAACAPRDSAVVKVLHAVTVEASGKKRRTKAGP